MKKTVLILAIVLVLAFMFTMTASATKPTPISGTFYFVDPWGPNDYCVVTSDGFIEGCVDQPVKPGLGAHGTMDLTMQTADGELSGACKYNLRTYDIDGIARFVANRCTGDLEGFHMKGVSLAYTVLWEGSYHFAP
jgi:hypothetical protein